MAKKTIANVDVKGKSVLIRVDFNVPLDENGKLSHIDFEIKDGVVTVKEAVLPLTPIVLILTVKS